MGREETVTGTEIKLKLFLCLFEALAGKVYGGIYLLFHRFLSSDLDGELLRPHEGHFNS